MKTITSSSTYILAGHMALRCDGLTIVEAPDKSKIGKMIQNKTHLDAMDRIASPCEFATHTGCTVLIGGQLVEPERKKKVVVQKPIVHSLINE